MLNLKKTALAVLALGSSAVFAGTMGPVCTPGSVTVPCERNAWSFGGKALYLQPVSQQFAGFQTTATGTRFNDFDHDWNWGFQLEASYLFSTGSDLTVNWYHLQDTTTRTQNVFFVDPTGATPGFNAITRVRYEPQWDAVNAEFGQHVDFGELSNIRFHAGAQYARIENDFRAGIVPAATLPLNTARVNSEFNGFGPRVGADLSYGLGNGFNIYANAAGALLVGDSKFNANTALFGLAAGNTNGSKTSVVPELEGKLGANYTFAMAQGALSVDGGYMWVNYFNAQNVGFLQSDFALQGPYLGLKWVGNV